MKKILILSNSSSGLYSFRFELMERLTKEYEVYISLPDDAMNDKFSDIGCHMIKTSINRRGINPLQDIGLFRAYLKLLNEIKPEAVLTYTIKPNVYGGMACRLKKIPTLVNMTGLGSALENGGLVQKIALSLYKIGVKNSKCIFAQNSYIKDFFEEKKITKAKVRLIPGSGVNLSRFETTDLPDNKLSFIYISRVMREKGIEELLAAAEIIKARYSNAEFHILGACEEEYQNILKEYEDKGIIKYHGNVTDVRPYIKNVACLLHPSFYPEGMSNVCLEAAASGRVVITTDRPGCRETVIDNKTGYIIPQKDTDVLVNAIERYISLPDEEKRGMGIESRKYVEKNFDRKLIIDAYLEELKN